MIEEGSYKDIKDDREILLEKLNDEKDIEKATMLRLALLGKASTLTYEIEGDL